MKRFLLVIVVLAVCTMAYAGDRAVVITAVTSDSAAGTVLVPNTKTVWTKAVPVSSLDDMNVWYKASSGGTINVKLELERGYALPTTEFAEDSNYVVSASDILNSSITTKQAHMASPDTVQMPYIRFRCTGQGSNDSNNSTRLTIKVGAK